MQSSTETCCLCAGGICNAEAALTGSGSATKNGNFQWWSGEFKQVTRIRNILLYLSIFPLNRGYYNRFKVETRITEREDWKTCKGEYSPKPQYSGLLHDLKCNIPTDAKYIRFSIKNGGPLYLNRVIVFGTNDTTSSLGTTKPLPLISGNENYFDIMANLIS